MLRHEDLIDYFRKGEKPRKDFKVGVEWEKVGVYRENFKAISYSGPRGVETILKALVRKFNWKPVLNDGRIIALKRGKASITLEPGGQIELSGQPAKHLDDNICELCCHLNEIRSISEPMGIIWLGLGLQPVSGLKDIEWVPKKRYRVMRELLKDKGELTFWMMKKTASIQVSVDYANEKDAMEKLRLGMALSPVFSSLFANSPIERGKPSGFLSKRTDIWIHTDPSRTGIIPAIFKSDASYEDYAEFALSAPMLFIERGGNWIAVKNLNFREYVKRGYRGLTATLADWELHLSGIFTDCRLKQYIEIRSIDCQTTPLAFSAPALIKGIFYNDSSRKKAWDLVFGLSLGELSRLRLQGARSGLRAKVGRHNVQKVAEKLIQLSRNGLLSGEQKYLQPLEEILFEKKKTPADSVLKNFQKNGLCSLQLLSL